MKTRIYLFSLPKSFFKFKVFFVCTCADIILVWCDFVKLKVSVYLSSQNNWQFLKIPHGRIVSVRRGGESPIGKLVRRIFSLPLNVLLSLHHSKHLSTFERLGRHILSFSQTDNQIRFYSF